MTTPDTITPVSGIHHITCVASDPQRNWNFYAGILGMRLIKVTVHFDDVEVYHLYYADELGTPGTILTFFPFPHPSAGQHGTGSIDSISLSVPSRSLQYWHARLAWYRVETRMVVERFGEPVLPFLDHDGQKLELVATRSADRIQPWRSGPVPARHAIRGLHGATIAVRRKAPTLRTLVQTLGLSLVRSQGQRFRLGFTKSQSGTFVDVVVMADGPEAAKVPLEGVIPEAGTVNHIAFGSSSAEQIAWREHLTKRGYRVTRIKDRLYFTSIYFLDPSGVRIEIATIGPGFMVDESIDQLGKGLQLPPWLEAMRESYQRFLPPLVSDSAKLERYRVH